MIQKFIFSLFFMFCSISAMANLSPSIFTYHGRIIAPNTLPLENNNVTFRVQVISPGPEACILYEEDHTKDMTGSEGLFSLNVGQGIVSPSNPGVGLPGSISNNAVFNTTFYPALTCSIGSSYTPGSGDTRKLRITFNYSGGGPVTVSPDITMNAAPYSMYASSVEGLGKNDLLQVKLGSGYVLNQTNLDAIFTTTNYPLLISAIDGTHTAYAKASDLPISSGVLNLSSGGVRVADAPATGDAAVNQNYTDTNLGGSNLDVTGVGSATGNGYVITWDQATETWVASAAGTTDNTKLPLAGGTMTGALNMGGENILATGHITMSPETTLNLGTYTTAQETTLIASPLGLADKGKTWFNSTSNKMKYWDGTTVISAGTDNTKLPLAGGTMTGAINMGGENILATGHVTMSPETTLNLGTYTNAQEVTLIASPLGAIDQGKTWYNSDTDTVMVWDGAAAVSSGVQLGTASGTAMEASALPNCSASQKIQASLGPTYSWTCVSENGDIEAITAGNGLVGTSLNSGTPSLDVNVDGSTLEINTDVVRVKSDGITTAHILDSTITKDDLATGSVESDEIADGTIVNADLANLSVNDAKISGVGIDKVQSGLGKYFTYAPNNTVCSNNEVLKWVTASLRWECASDNNVSDHGALTGLADDDHTQYVMLAGRAGGQSVNGGTAASEDLTLESTSHATKGDIILNPTSGNVGIGSATPDTKLHVDGTIKIGNDGETCSVAGDAGMFRYNTGNMEFCNGTAWTALATSGSGENNTASNQGLGGIGLFDTKSGADLQFKNINAGSSSVTISNDAVNKEVDIDINIGNLETALNHDDLTGFEANEHIDHTAVTITAGDGLTGGGTIATTRNLAVNVDDSTIEINTDTLQVKDSGITSAKVALDTLVAADIATGAVTSDEILDSTIIKDDLATGSVESDEIADGSIATVDLADGSVTDAKIGTVSVDKIVSGATKYFTYAPNNTVCVNNEVLKWDNTNTRWVCGSDNSGVSDHGALTGLTDDDHTQYVMLAGRAGGQTVQGGTAASEDLTLESTSHATKGDIILNPTSGNVGVGTTAPTAALDIADGGISLIVGADSGLKTRTNSIDKNSRIGMPHYLTTEEPVALIRGRSAAGVNTVDIGGGTGLLNTSTSIRFYTAGNTITTTGSERMTINNDGNVGIGTTSPGHLLHVQADDNSSSVGIKNRTLGLDSISMISVQNDGENWQLATDGAISDTFSIRQSGTERLSIDTSGNVGIGTSNPVANLDLVKDSGIPNATASDPGNYVESAAFRIRTTFSGGGNGLSMGVDDSSGSRTSWIQSGHMQTANVNLATSSELLLQPVGGKVGIGSVSPNTRLEVAGSLRIGDGGETCSINYAGAMRYNSSTIQFCNGTSWLTMSSTGAGDNLGNHTATTDLNMDTNTILGGTASGNDLFLESTSHATKGDIILNPSGGNVGIGTTSPSALLDVVMATDRNISMAYNSSRPTLNLKSNLDGNAPVLLQLQSTSTSGTISGNRSLEIRNYHTAIDGSKENTSVIDAQLTSTGATSADLGGRLLFKTKSPGNSYASTRMAIAEDGKIGIGIGTPDEEVHVFKEGSAVEFKLETTADGGSPRISGYRSRGTNAAKTAIVNGNVMLSLLGYGYDGTGHSQQSSITLKASEIWSGSSKGTKINFNATENGTVLEETKMTILGSGNVGIGTSVPDTKLDVAGSIKVGDGGETCGVTYAGAMRYNSSTIQFCNGSSWLTVSSTGAGDNLGDHTATANIQLGTNYLSGDGDNEGVFVSSGGKVGVGTNSPIGDLSVADVTVGYPALFVTGKADDELDLAVPAGEKIHFGTHDGTLNGGTTTMMIDASGNVGIGTVGPTHKLHVNGIIKAGGNVGAGKIQFDGVDVSTTPGQISIFENNGGLNLESRGGVQVFVDNNGDQTSSFSVGGNGSGNDLFMVRDDGHTGIGTTSPSHRAHIVEASTIGSVGSFDTSNAALRIQETPGASPSLYMDGNTIVGDHQIALGTLGNQDINLITNETVRMTVESDGDVGIGTTSPLSQLHLESSSTEIITMSHTNGSGYDTEIGAFYNVGKAFSIKSANVEHYAFAKSDNSVTIGGGTSNSILRVKSSPSTVSRIRFEGANGADNVGITAGTGSTANMIIHTGGSDSMKIEASGDVGIGTTAPAAKLHVDGSGAGGGVCVTSDNTCSAVPAAGEISAETTLNTGADYAEYFEAEENLLKGDIVGLNLTSGKVRAYQSGDQLLGVVSTSPGVIGNSDLRESDTAVLVALVGQVPVIGDQVYDNGGIVFTKNGESLGYRLANGNVYLNLSSGTESLKRKVASQEAKNASQDSKITSQGSKIISQDIEINDLKLRLEKLEKLLKK